MPSASVSVATAVKPGARRRWRTPQLAHAEDEVLAQLGQQLSAPATALALRAQAPALGLDAGEVAEPPHRLGARLGLAHPLRHQLPHSHGEVEVELFLHLLGHARPELGKTRPANPLVLVLLVHRDLLAPLDALRLLSPHGDQRLDAPRPQGGYQRRSQR